MCLSSFFVLRICIIICNIITRTESIQTIEVSTALGPIRGKLVDDSTSGAYYYAFQGIPYAEPPVGKLRFKPPVKKRAWSIVHDATKPGRVCPQIEMYYSRKQMDENCLNFNIYTPVNFLNKKFPVMFFVHGGEYKLQSGNAEPIFGPQFYILNNIIVVTMNYRLGALGFLSLCNEEVSGNAGIKDVLLLLKIVQDVIKQFGGDPRKVTIMGYGAGAAIVELLMLSDQCKGLFQRAILHSGSILNTEFTQSFPKQNAILLCQELGINLKDTDSMLKELRRKNAFDIVEALEAIGRRDAQRGFRKFNPFKPTVEMKSESAIIIRPPLELIREGAILDIPIFIGFTNQEGLEMLPVVREEPELIDKLNDNFELCIPADIQYPRGSVESRNLAADIRHFYFYGRNISFVNFQSYINLISDTLYTYAIDSFVKLFKQRKTAPVYYYVFEVDGALNWFKKSVNITYLGASHNDDIAYTFLTLKTKSIYQNLDSTTRKAQRAALLNTRYFIYYGAPTPNAIVDCWPEAGNNRYHIRQGSEAVAIFHRPIPERIDFWSAVYEKYFSSKWNIDSYFCTNDDIF